MISSGTRSAVDDIVRVLTSTHQTMLLSGGLVDTFIAVPVTLGDLGDGGLETVGVVTLVTTITQQHRVFVILALADLVKAV